MTQETGKPSRSLFKNDFFFLITALLCGVIVLFFGYFFLKNLIQTNEEIVQLKKFVPTEEIEIGSFSYLLQDTEAEEGKTIRVFEFDASVMLPQGRTNTDSLLSEIYQHKGRIEQLFEEVIRSATKEELQDPGLDRIRQQMKDGINEVTGKELIDDLQFSHFRHFNTLPQTSDKRRNWEARRMKMIR